MITTSLILIGLFLNVPTTIIFYKLFNIVDPFDDGVVDFDILMFWLFFFAWPFFLTFLVGPVLLYRFVFIYTINFWRKILKL